MIDQIEARLKALRGKLAARDGKHNAKAYGSNVVAIKAEIARLESVLETHKGQAEAKRKK